MDEEGQRNPAWSRNPDVWYPALLVVAGILFFADPLFSSKNFYFRDILNFHYPLRKVLIDSYARGEFPLWNPYVYLGQPMLANPNYMAFYPTNLFHLFMPFNYAFKLHFIVHPLLGGLGLYFLQRRLGIVPLAALGGSVVYQFSGTVLSFLNLYNIVPVVALMPWLGWAFVGALEGDWWRRSLLFGGVLALQIIACEPLTFECTLWLLVGLAILNVAESTDRLEAVKATLRVGLVGVTFGLALSAVQLLPTLELIPLSARASGLNLSVATEWSLHPLDLLNVVVPNLFGSPYTLGMTSYWGEYLHNGREGYLVSFFQGSAATVVAFLSLLFPRKNLRWIFVALALIGIFLALGKYNPIYQGVIVHIPLFGLGRYPSKLFLLVALGLAMLASLGLEGLLRPESPGSAERRRILTVAFIAIVFAGSLLGIWYHWYRNPAGLERLLRLTMDSSSAAVKDFQEITSSLLFSVRLSGVFLLLSGGLFAASKLSRRPFLFVSMLILLMSGELISANLRLVPLISETGLEFVPEVFTYILNNGPREPFRVLPPDVLGKKEPFTIFSPNRSSAWLTHFYRNSGKPMHGIAHSIQYSFDRPVDHLNTRESEELWKACVLLPQSDAIALLKKVNSPVLLSLSEMSDSQVGFKRSFETRSNRELRLYWIENCLPRAYFASGITKAASQDDALQKFVAADFPYGDTLILESEGVQERSAQRGSGLARIIDYRSSRIICEVEGKTAGYLVLLDSYYPGWRATIDGREAEIVRANCAFRAVAVPAGSHRVEFVYRPRSFYLGLGISILAASFGVVSTWCIWRKSGQMGVGVEWRFDKDPGQTPAGEPRE